MSSRTYISAEKKVRSKKETFSLKDPFAWEFFACPHFKSDIRKDNRRSHVKLDNILFFLLKKKKWNETDENETLCWIMIEDEWHENEALHLIMMMVKAVQKKNNQQIYLQKKIKK